MGRTSSGGTEKFVKLLPNFSEFNRARGERFVVCFILAHHSSQVFVVKYKNSAMSVIRDGFCASNSTSAFFVLAAHQDSETSPVSGEPHSQLVKLRIANFPRVVLAFDRNQRRRIVEGQPPEESVNRDVVIHDVHSLQPIVKFLFETKVAERYVEQGRQEFGDRPMVGSRSSIVRNNRAYSVKHLADVCPRRAEDHM
jgi:hypothetical protein